VNLNSDLGEAAGPEAEILPLIDSANVCCGVHAGSVTASLETVRRCHQLGIEVGAHPGYDDRANFGRVEVPLRPEEIEQLVRFQVGALAAVASLGYIKVHGALYHRCQADPAAADALARVARDFGVGLLGQPGFEILVAARRAGVPGHREGYADRAYLPDGRLRPRTEKGAVLSPEEAAEQALRLLRSGDYDTVCVHGDSPGSAQVVHTVREGLRQAGVRTGPLKR